MDTLEKLVLLEILVDNVYYERTVLDPALMQQLQDTNVRFQFFDFPPIDIGEIDFCQTAEGFERSEVSFKSGKSVLFALPDVPSGMGESLDLNVTVSRKYATKKGEGEGENDAEWKLHDIGKTIIHLGESFVNLLDATSYDGVCPASRTVRDSYPFAGDNGEVVGFVTVFVRLSCFGKIIVTQFQADGIEDKSFYFKGGEDEATPATPPEADVEQPCPQFGMGGMGQPPMMMPPPYMMPGPMSSMYPQSINVPVPLKKRETISKCGKVPSELVSSDSEGEKKPYCLHRKCPQGFPLPPWVSGGRKTAKRKTPGPPVGSAAFQGDDILFQMRHPMNQGDIGNKGDTIYKVNNEPGQDRQQVQMMKPDLKPEADDENDVFLLRFGKRDAQNKPAKLILTMKTPKAPIFKEHKCTSDQISQTECPIRKAASEQSTALTTTQVAEALGKSSGSDTEKSGKAPGKGKKGKKK